MLKRIIRYVCCTLGIIMLLTYIPSTSARASSENTITNDTFWMDTEGNPIYSQGGGIFKYNGKYYWYGVKYQGAETYYSSPTKKNSDTTFESVTCYSSTDLVNWKFENDVLTADTAGLEGCSWLGRLGVAYCSTTEKYVLVTQFIGDNGSGILFATCDSPNGDYAYDHIQESVSVAGTTSSVVTGDQTVFIDDDGSAYLIFSNSGGRGNIYVAPLRTNDFLAVEEATKVGYNANGREGNCMFKYNGVYYICSSDLHGWNASQTYYLYSSNIYGTYTDGGVLSGTESDFSHVSQSGFFVTVSGSEQTTVIYCGDRWCDFAGNGLGYNQWCPLSFVNGEPYFNSVSQWNLDAETGTWSVGAENNYVLNPSFEADRVSVTDITGWSKWYSNSSMASAAGNLNKKVTGNWCACFYDDEAYNTSIYQNISVPNGTYILSAYVMSSGGQNSATVYAGKCGNDGQSVSVNSKISSWTKIVSDEITVTNGRIQVGVWCDANAGNWLRVDDIELKKVE